MVSNGNPALQKTVLMHASAGPLQVTVLLHHDPSTGGLSASMDNCPGGDCVQAPNMEDDLAIKCGCVSQILDRLRDSWMLQFLAWITGQG